MSRWAEFRARCRQPSADEVRRAEEERERRKRQEEWNDPFDDFQDLLENERLRMVRHVLKREGFTESEGESKST